MSESLRMGVVVDYQNLHLSAADMFMPGRPVWEALIDPYQFACQLALTRANTNDRDRKSVV